MMDCTPDNTFPTSPLAEGRELKWGTAARGGDGFRSPLAEGRELKLDPFGRVNRAAAVAPRGGA